MIKKITVAAIAVVLFSHTACADTALRPPQGRLGTSFKTEKISYPPTNLSNQEFKNIHKQVNKLGTIPNETKNSITQKQPENSAAQTKKKEDQSLKNLQRQKIAEKKQIEIQQAKEEKTQQKIKLVEQKQINAKNKIEEKERTAAQRQAEAIKKQAEKEQRAAQKAEEKRLKQEKKTTSILANENQTGNKKLSKINFKFGKKDKNKNEPIIEDIDNNTQTEIQNKESDNEEIDTTKYVQDSDTKNIVKEITTELANDRPQMLDELSKLWVSAVQKSDTVYFAIMKLSNPNGEEVNKNGFKKILEPILSAAPLVGQAFVNPALTAGSIIGSNVMGTMINDGIKNRLAKVNDADLVILARAIDELQESLLMNYMAYKGAKEAYEQAIKIAEERQQEYETMNKKNSQNTILANTFYTEALDYQYKARQDFLMKRVVLEQMVGAEALNEIENPQKEENNNAEIETESKE